MSVEQGICSKANYRLIGIDPGSRKTGFGILEVGSDSIFRYIAHGTIFLDVKKDIYERLYDLSRALREIVNRYEPDLAAIESAFVGKNVQSALALGQARGVVMGVLGLSGVICHSISPLEVKKHVTGSGRAQKFQINKMVGLRLGLNGDLQEDAADALAVALSAALGRKASLRIRSG